jgi:hypothetical protein
VRPCSNYLRRARNHRLVLTLIEIPFPTIALAVAAERQTPTEGGQEIVTIIYAKI